MTDVASPLAIRRAVGSDGEAVATIHREVAAAGDTFAWTLDPSDEKDAAAFWDVEHGAVYVATWDGRVAGAYRLRANQPGRGAHVANAAYMVAARDRGHGLGEAMGAHSLIEARALGYAAMQFNLVVSTNESAVQLWSKLGFAVVGRIPAAFRHARAGLVDALVMHRFLGDAAAPTGGSAGASTPVGAPAIRSALSSDTPAIARLSTQLGYPQEESAAGSALRAIRTEGSGDVLVALNGGGEVVGWIGVFLARRVESELFAEIGGLVVDESARGRGIGASLVAAAESWAAARGAPTIRVRSNMIRKDAHRFYTAHGYATVKTQAVFVKELAASAGGAAPAPEAPRRGTAPARDGAYVSFSGTLARVVLFPVKSLDGQDAQQARILPSGALEHDRRFAIVDRAGIPVNGKREPRVHRLRTSYDPSSRRITLRRSDDAAARAFSMDEERPLLESWLGEFFGYPVELHEEESRGFPDDRDAPGPTLVAAETLEEVAGWFSGITPQDLARRFRANLVVAGFPAFGDDRLVGGAAGPVRFRVGSVSFEGVNPCQRCAVPTRDPESGEADPRFAKTFAARRRETLPPWAPKDRFDHFYRFTVNTRLWPGTSGGVIQVGDPVELVEGAP